MSPYFFRGRGKTMWHVAGRMAGVFAVWGLVLVVAIGGGLGAHFAESLAVCGAAFSLISWGLSITRHQRRIDAAAHEPAQTPDGERASV